MKTAQLRVGIKGKEAVSVPLQIPETVDELLTAAKGSQEVVLRWAKRGLAIEAQERSGARDVYRELSEAGKTKEEITAEVAKAVAEYDPTVAAARGGPRVRKPVEIKAGANGKLSLEDFKAQLEAAGVKVNITQGA